MVKRRGDVAPQSRKRGRFRRARWFRGAPAFRAEVVGPGFTRLVSAPPDDLPAIHRALVRRPSRRVSAALPAAHRPLDRTARQTPSITSPSSWGAPAVPRGTRGLRAARCHHDGRHQLWIEGRHDAKVVPEETGVIYVCPDDLVPPTCSQVSTTCGRVPTRTSAIATTSASTSSSRPTRPSPRLGADAPAQRWERRA